MDPQSNPASNIGPYTENLASQMQAAKGTTDIATLRQVQANLIDTSKALSGKLAELTVESERAGANLQNLAVEVAKEKNAKSKQYKELSKEIAIQSKAKYVADRTAAAIGVAHKAYNDGLVRITKTLASNRMSAKAAADAEKERATAYKSSFAFKKGIDVQSTIAGKSGLLGEAMAKAMSNAARGGGTGSLIGVGATKALGDAHMAASALAKIFSTATTNTTSFVDAFGPMGGLYVKAQAAFGEAAGGMMTMRYSLADSAKVAAIAMKDGALGNYAAVNLLKRGGQDATVVSVDMARVMGELSTSVLLAGKAMGMTTEESGKLLGSVNAMGAFSGATLTAGSHMGKLNNAFTGFTVGADKTGLSISRMAALTGSFANAMLPLGASFAKVQAQALSTSIGLSELIQSTDAKTYLNNAEAAQKFTESLLQLGKGIAAPQMAGYRILAGQGTGNAMRDVAEAISASPTERLASQLQMIMKSSDDKYQRAVMMRQYIPEDTTQVLSNMMIQQPKLFDKFLKGMNTKDPDAILKMAKTPGMEGMEKIAKELSLGRDPLDQLIELGTNMLTQLSRLTGGMLTWIDSPGVTAAANLIGPSGARTVHGSRAAAHSVLSR